MECPYCQKEMIAGYIYSGAGAVRRLQWKPETENPFLGIMVFTKRRINLGIREAWSRVGASNCTHCKKMIVDYSSK